MILDKQGMLDRNKTIAISALNGATLEKVASEFHITRERVRQIAAKMLRIACTKFLGHSSGYPESITLKAIRKNAAYYTDAIAKLTTSDYYKDPYSPFLGQHIRGHKLCQ